MPKMKVQSNKLSELVARIRLVHSRLYWMGQIVIVFYEPNEELQVYGLILESAQQIGADVSVDFSKDKRGAGFNNRDLLVSPTLKAALGIEEGGQL